MTAPLFPLLHDGSAACVERIEFDTALQLAYDGTETATQIRDLPRVTISGTYKGTASGAGPVALALIQGGGLVQLPLGCHAASVFAADALDFGINADAPLAIAGNNGGLFASLAVPATSGFPAGAAWVAPSAEAWLANSREIDWNGASPSWSAQLSFELTSGYREAVPALTGALTFPVAVLSDLKVSETRTAQQDKLDYNRVWLLSQRYIKRSVKLSIGIVGRTNIAAFRQFIYACAGTLNRFTWQAPADSAPGTWRLGADATELQYVTRGYVKVALELVQI